MYRVIIKRKILRNLQKLPKGVQDLFNHLVTDAYLETVRRTIAAAKRLLPLRDRYGDPSQPLTVNMHLHYSRG